MNTPRFPAVHEERRNSMTTPRLLEHAALESGLKSRLKDGEGQYGKRGSTGKLEVKPRLVGVDDQITSARHHHHQTNEKLHAHIQEQIEWMMTNEGFVAMESVSSIEDCRVVLSAMLSSMQQPIALQLRIEAVGCITAMLQASDQFRSDFMMLQIDNKYCLFLE